MRGEYFARCGSACRARLLAVAILSTALSMARAHGEVLPPRGGVDGRIRSAVYNVDQVYRLHGLVGYQIDIEFASDEAFVGLGAGDIEGLAYFGEANHLFLKPRAERVATNLTVLTNRRHYYFDYTAMAQRPTVADSEVIFALRFTYPEDKVHAAAVATEAHIDADLKSASGRRQQNLDYRYCGSPALKPVYAADDGVHTRLRFAANAELPAIFVRGDDAAEALLNYSMDQGDVIIHRVAQRFILRRGRLQGCIVNGAYAGGGVRLESGTVTPDVERRIQGVAP